MYSHTNTKHQNSKLWLYDNITYGICNDILMQTFKNIIMWVFNNPIGDILIHMVETMSFAS